MTPATPAPPPLPGSMTVSLLFGWQSILIALLVVVVVTVLALALIASGKDGSTRSDWRAWLDERSARRPDVEDDGEPVEASAPEAGVPIG